MKQNLNNRVVIITGAGGGIGRATAERLAKEKMRVVLFGGNNQKKLYDTEVMVREYTQCLTLPGDLTDMDFVNRAVIRVLEAYDDIDVLINNAGMALSSSFEDVSENQFDRIMNINIKVPYFLTQKVIPALKRSPCATIINISSVVGHAGYPLQSAYAASKHALLGFTKSLASEYYRDQIRVHAICPGGVFTDMVKVARPDLSAEGMITPQEISEIIWFFLSNRGNAVVDEIIVHRVNKEPFLV